MKTVVGICGLLALGVAACAGEEPIVGISSAESTGTGGSGGTPAGTRYVLQSLSYHEAPAESCLPRPLAIDASGRSTCDLVAVSSAPDGAPISDVACDCAERGLRPASPTAKEAVLAEMERSGACFTGDPSSGALPCAEVCLCEVPQAEGSSWRECAYETSPSSDSRGFCYVEPSRGVGSRVLVEGCAAPAARVRALGGMLAENQGFFALCHAESSGPVLPAEDELPVGGPCVPPDESFAVFSGFAESEVSVYTGVEACASRLCVANHFRGRVSCPYGQTAEEALTDPQCFLPGSDVAVTTKVEPQLVDRRADDVVTCSCRCDGPGPGNYCACPTGTECVPLIRPLGLPGDAELAGSYCVPVGTAYDARSLDPTACSPETQSCGEARPY